MLLCSSDKGKKACGEEQYCSLYGENIGECVDCPDSSDQCLGNSALYCRCYCGKKFDPPQACECATDEDCLGASNDFECDVAKNKCYMNTETERNYALYSKAFPPTFFPTKKPSAGPTTTPSQKPSAQPSTKPTLKPTSKPSETPTPQPSTKPTCKPSAKPTKNPTTKPSNAPTKKPTSKPTTTPTKKPTSVPSKTPTNKPSCKPTKIPSKSPTQTVYVKQAENTNICINGDSVKEENECRKAALFLNLRFQESGRWDDSPRGCYASSGDTPGVYFNRDIFGESHEHESPICRTTRGNIYTNLMNMAVLNETRERLIRSF